MALSHPEKTKSPGSTSRRGKPEPITLGMTRPMADALDLLSEQIGAPIEDVLTQAVALLMVAVDAQNRARDSVLQTMT